MNFVEQNTWNYLSDHITRLDPDRLGWCIDAGVGDGDYYFEWFKGLGYPTLAIEPLPTSEARRILEESGVRFLEVALGAADSIALMHTARNIHALDKGLWGESEDSHSVVVQTWETTLFQAGITRITALKLDIEGSEGAVIRQLPGKPTPGVVSFEFGGVWARSSGRGSWSMTKEAELLRSLRHLHGMDYREGVVISSGDSDRLLPIALERRMDIDALFPLDTNWGNIVVWMEG